MRKQSILPKKGEIFHFQPINLPKKVVGELVTTSSDYFKILSVLENAENYGRCI